MGLAFGFKWFLVALFIFGILSYITDIGKPREPIKPTTAAFVVAMNLVIMFGLIFLWKL